MKAIVVAVLVCLIGGTLVKGQGFDVAFSGGGSSSTEGVLGCPYLAGSTVTGTRAQVSFKSLRAGGVEYTKVYVPEDRVTLMDVELVDLGSPSLPGCVQAASDKKVDAFSFKDGQCQGYNIGEGLCPCTSGDLELYRAPQAMRTTSARRGRTVAKTRQDPALPAGYVRKIIYPVFPLDDISRAQTADGPCEDLLASTDPSVGKPWILHYKDDTCYYMYAFSNYPCDSCDGPATEVIVWQNANPIIMTSQCDQSIPIKVIDASTSPGTIQTVISHDGYGCIPYPELATTGDCILTMTKPASTSIIGYGIDSGHLDIDGESTCAGDALYIYKGTEDTTTLCIDQNTYSGTDSTADRLTLKFHRDASRNPGSVNVGFDISTFAA